MKIKFHVQVVPKKHQPLIFGSPDKLNFNNLKVQYYLFIFQIEKNKCITMFNQEKENSWNTSQFINTLADRSIHPVKVKNF